MKGRRPVAHRFKEREYLQPQVHMAGESPGASDPVKLPPSSCTTRGTVHNIFRVHSIPEYFGKNKCNGYPVSNKDPHLYSRCATCSGATGSPGTRVLCGWHHFAHILRTSVLPTTLALTGGRPASGSPGERGAPGLGCCLSSVRVDHIARPKRDNGRHAGMHLYSV